MSLTQPDLLGSIYFGYNVIGRKWCAREKNRLTASSFWIYLDTGFGLLRDAAPPRLMSPWPAPKRAVPSRVRRTADGDLQPRCVTLFPGQCGRCSKMLDGVRAHAPRPGAAAVPCPRCGGGRASRLTRGIPRLTLSQSCVRLSQTEPDCVRLGPGGAGKRGAGRRARPPWATAPQSGRAAAGSEMTEQTGQTEQTEQTGVVQDAIPMSPGRGASSDCDFALELHRTSR